MNPSSLRDICLRSIGTDLDAYETSLLPQDIKDDIYILTRWKMIETKYKRPVVIITEKKEFKHNIQIIERYYIDNIIQEISITDNDICHKTYRFKDGKLDYIMKDKGSFYAVKYSNGMKDRVGKRVGYDFEPGLFAFFVADT